MLQKNALVELYPYDYTPLGPNSSVKANKGVKRTKTEVSVTYRPKTEGARMSQPSQ